jgi:alkylhydroperoxidase family enzyme
MTLDVKVTDEVFNALRQHLHIAQIVELTSAVATYNMARPLSGGAGVSSEA